MMSTMSLSCELKQISGKYFKMRLKKRQFWFDTYDSHNFETYGSQKATVLGDW